MKNQLLEIKAGLEEEILQLSVMEEKLDAEFQDSHFDLGLERRLHNCQVAIDQATKTIQQIKDILEREEGDQK